MWWPRLDPEIEVLARSCAARQSVKYAPAVVPLRRWPWPDKPFERVHVDFCRTYSGDNVICTSGCSL